MNLKDAYLGKTLTVRLQASRSPPVPSKSRKGGAISYNIISFKNEENIAIKFTNIGKVTLLNATEILVAAPAPSKLPPTHPTAHAKKLK